MADKYHLQRRGAIWYYVRRVPAALAAAFGSVVKISLHTQSKAEAKRLRTKYDAEFDEKFAQATMTRSSEAKNLPTSALTLDDILESVRQAVSASDARFAKELISDPPRDAIEKQDLLIDAEIEYQILSDHFDPRRDQVIKSFLKKLLKQASLSLPTELASESEEIARRALLELSHRKIDRYADRYDRPYHDLLFAPQRPSVSFQKLVNEYAADIKEAHDVNNVGLNRREKVAAFLTTLVEIIGPAYAIDQIDDAKVQEVRAVLARMPANRAKIYPKFSLAEAIVQAESEGRAPISATTQADYLRVFKDVFRFGMRRKYLAFDPAAGAKPLKKPKPADELRMPFTHDQLKSFFTGSFYSSGLPCLPEFYGTPGRDWRYWIPLLMLLSGARPNELAQLRAGDIRQSDAGNPYLNLFREAGEEPIKLKSRTSRRRIPIHSELVKLGFLQFVECRRNAADAKAALFPTLKENRFGNRAYYVSKRFNEVFLPSEIEVAKDQCLYSLRHNVRDALRQIGAPPEALRAITGWSQGGKNASDYYGDATNPDHYVKWVNGISYPGLDLSFLHV